MDANSLLQRIRKEGRNFFLYTEAKKFLETCKIPVTKTKIAKNQKEAIQAAKSIGFPVVMKIFSPDVVHKSDSGGVITDLRTGKEVAQVFDKIMKNYRKSKSSVKIDGVIIEKMLSGVEVIIGVTKDPQFGHVLMFGMGGVLVELLKDISFRLIPIVPADAKEMIRDVKGFPLLEGFRGQKGNIESLENIMLKVSTLIVQHPEIVEMDLNPVFTSVSGSIVGDVRIIISN
jgi:acetyl-CoA synthetase (ADP-forming)